MTVLYVCDKKAIHSIFSCQKNNHVILLLGNAVKLIMLIHDNCDIVTSTLKMHQGAAENKHYLGQGQQDHLNIICRTTQLI